MSELMTGHEVHEGGEGPAEERWAPVAEHAKVQLGEAGALRGVEHAHAQNRFEEPVTHQLKHPDKAKEIDIIKRDKKIFNS